VSDPDIVADSHGFSFSQLEKLLVILAKPKPLTAVRKMMLRYPVIGWVIRRIDTRVAGNGAEFPDIGVKDLIISREIRIIADNNIIKNRMCLNVRITTKSGSCKKNIVVNSRFDTEYLV
jgi:hypothetical protein